LACPAAGDGGAPVLGGHLDPAGSRGGRRQSEAAGFLAETRTIAATAGATTLADEPSGSPGRSIRRGRLARGIR